MSDDRPDPLDARWRGAMFPLRGSGEPSTTLEARVRASLGAQHPRTRTGRSRLVWAGIAALTLVTVAAALFRLGPGSSAPAAGPRYLLLLYEGSRFDTGGATHEQMVAEYSAWAKGLSERGKLVEASELREEERLSSGVGESTRGAAGVISGFFIVRAVDMKEAAAIAASCPHLKYGGEVAVRPLRDE